MIKHRDNSPFVGAERFNLERAEEKQRKPAKENPSNADVSLDHLPPALDIKEIKLANKRAVCKSHGFVREQERVGRKERERE